MSANRLRLFLRGAHGRCPRCQSGNLFVSRFRLRSTCLHCGLPLEQEDGWSLGAIPLNYSITCICWILPVAIAFLLGWLSLTPALLLAGSGALLLPFLTYRFSKSLWIGLYYAILPHELESEFTLSNRERPPSPALTSPIKKSSTENLGSLGKG